MKQRNLGNSYLSTFCLELSLFLNAGINLSDGLHLLIEDDDDKRSRELIAEIAKCVDQNIPLSSALTELKIFPDYMVKMILLGEQTGRLSDTLKALSVYYDRQERLSLMVRNSLVYPTILLLMMVVVVIILITIVLPIFNDVFHQLGASMPPFAITMMSIGAALSQASLVFAFIAAIILLFGLSLLIAPKFRARCGRIYRDLRRDKGLSAKIALARFSSAMSMALKSGLDINEAFSIASQLSVNSTISEKKHKLCAQYLDDGYTLAEALTSTKIFPAVYSRMLSLGVKSGTADTVLSEIARRTHNSVNDDLENLLGRIEPSLVIITSLIVGVILLSVMLPLMNIMSVIG